MHARHLIASLLAVGLVQFAPAQEARPEGPANGSESTGERPLVAPEHHPWAHFPIGSWKKVRITEEAYDETEKLVSESVTIRLERLQGIGPQHFSLTQEVTISVGGRQVEAPPQTVTLGLVTEEPGKFESLTSMSPEAVTLEGRQVDAEVFEVATSGDVHSVTTRLWYSADEPPHILRSITQAISTASQESVWLRTRKVLARNLPFVLGGRHGGKGETQVAATFVEEDHTTSKAVRHSILVYADEIPGGIAARWTKEVNNEGRLVRREMETLLDWGAAPHAANDRSAPPAGSAE
jgi:hypothetical protein